MISPAEIQALLADLECDRVERTISTTNTDKFAEAVTAFCNDLPNHRQPGYLILGATDDGSLSNLTVTDELLKNLGGLRADGNIQPLPVLHVQKIILAGGEVAVVEIKPSDLPPVRYKGRVWIRVGPRKAVATQQEERILTEKRIAHSKSFDAQPCLESTLDDLAIDLFRINYLNQAVAREIIDQNHRDVKEQLASLRFYNSHVECPTNAGIMLFGKNPLEWLPCAFVQFLHVEGTRLEDDVLDERAISGDLLTVLRELDSLVERQITQRPIFVSALGERALVNYPVAALREILMNAVMHRTYESNSPIRFYRFKDRIELQSPGGLYGEASRENFPNQNSYRNPVLAEAMKTLGFVNRFGRGVLRAQEELRKNGNKPAEFYFDHHYVRVVIWEQDGAGEQ